MPILILIVVIAILTGTIGSVLKIAAGVVLGIFLALTLLMLAGWFAVRRALTRRGIGGPRRR